MLLQQMLTPFRQGDSPVVHSRTLWKKSDVIWVAMTPFHLAMHR